MMPDSPTLSTRVLSVTPLAECCFEPPVFQIRPPPEPWAFLESELSIIEPCIVQSGQNLSDFGSNGTVSDPRRWTEELHWSVYIIASVIFFTVISLSVVLLLLYLKRRGQMAKSRSVSKSAILTPSSSNHSSVQSTQWSYNSMKPLTKRQLPTVPSGPKAYATECHYASNSICNGIDSRNASIRPNFRPSLRKLHSYHESTDKEPFYHTLNASNSSRFVAEENPTYEEISMNSFGTPCTCDTYLDRRPRSLVDSSLFPRSQSGTLGLKNTSYTIGRPYTYGREGVVSLSKRNGIKHAAPLSSRNCPCENPCCTCNFACAIDASVKDLVL